MDSKVLSYIDVPFPRGESYKEVEIRVKKLLDYLIDNYDNKHIAIVSHRGPQLALEVIINKKKWAEAFRDDWRLKGPKAWQPGWKYVYKK